MKAFLFLLIFIHIPCVWAEEDSSSRKLPLGYRPYIRVALKTESPYAELYSIGSLTVRLFSDSSKNLTWKGTLYIQASDDSIHILNGWGACASARDSIVFTSFNPFNYMEVDSLEYRGDVIVLLNPDKKSFLLVNKVTVDDYLRGVLPFEIGKHDMDKLEALKAQAVAARTYTFKRIALQKESRPFDVYADVRDQVYKGKSGEYLLSDRAVRETGGIVALYNDSLIECYYSSTCGGKTASVSEVWPDKPDAPYLRSVEDRDRAGVHCKDSKMSDWKQDWTFSEMERSVKKYLQGFYPTAALAGSLRELRVDARARCGRIKELSVIMERDKYVVRGDQVRWLMRRPEEGSPILYSAWFDLQKKPIFGKPKQYTATGKGWGHGVGMCQRGCLGMAAKGYRFDQILKHYYTGIHLVIWEY